MKDLPEGDNEEPTLPTLRGFYYVLPAFPGDL